MDGAEDGGIRGGVAAARAGAGVGEVGTYEVWRAMTELGVVTKRERWRAGEVWEHNEQTIRFTASNECLKSARPSTAPARLAFN